MKEGIFLQKLEPETLGKRKKSVKGRGPGFAAGKKIAEGKMFSFFIAGKEWIREKEKKPKICGWEKIAGKRIGEEKGKSVERKKVFLLHRWERVDSREREKAQDQGLGKIAGKRIGEEKEKSVERKKGIRGFVEGKKTLESRVFSESERWKKGDRERLGCGKRKERSLRRK